jgi:hypothetical protein
MEILPVAVRLFANANTAFAAKHALYVRDEPLRFVEKPLLAQRLVERHEKDQSESIGPKIAQAIGPDMLRAHPIELGQHMLSVLQSAHKRSLYRRSQLSQSRFRRNAKLWPTRRIDPMQRALLSLIAGSVFASLSAAVAAAPLPPKPVTATLLKHTGSAGGAGGVSAGNVAAVGIGAMSSGGVGGVGGVGGAGAYPGGKVNRPGPSVIWYPPQYSAKKQRRADQSCQWLYQKANSTGTRYWRTRYNNCVR